MKDAVVTVDIQKELSKRGISLDIIKDFKEKELKRKSTFY